MVSYFTASAALVGGACFLGMMLFSLWLVTRALKRLPALLQLKSRMERTLVKPGGQ